MLATYLINDRVMPFRETVKCYVGFGKLVHCILLSNGQLLNLCQKGSFLSLALCMC